MRIVYIHHAHRNMENGKDQENQITDYGIQEASIMGKILRGASVKVIFCGDFNRYKQTAECLNKHIKAPILIDSRLNEWNGEIESPELFEKRTHEFLKEIINKYEDDDTIFCITSGANLDKFISFFIKGEKTKGLDLIQSVGICPIIFHYSKNK